METAILMGLIGLGYLQSNSNRDEAHPSIHPEINTPTHSSVYDQNNFEESKKQEEILAKDVIERMNRRETNIVDVNRATNNEHRLSGLNVGEHDTLNYVEVPQIEQQGLQASLGQGDQDVSEYVYSQQLNAYVKRDDFLTNDQGISSVPYFKGTEAPTINYDDVRYKKC